MQGYRFEPAVPGVQEDHVAILRFDSEDNLNAWLESPERRKLVEEAGSRTVGPRRRAPRTPARSSAPQRRRPDPVPERIDEQRPHHQRRSDRVVDHVVAHQPARLSRMRPANITINSICSPA